MGLKKSPQLTADYVLSQVDDATIFGAYYGDFEFRTISPSVFRKDENPSCGFYVSEKGRIIYNDIATSEKLDCFAFVAKLYKLSYGKAILRVACDFGLVEGCEKKFDKNDIKKAQKVSENIKRHTDIKIIPDKWSPAYLNFWDQFSITQEELEREEVYPIKKLIVNDTDIPNFSKNVRFAFILRFRDEMYKKIYCPYATNKKFKWISNTPIYIPFGFNSLPYKSDTLIITKAQKDRIIFKKFFTDVIGLQNESPSALREATLSYLKRRYKKIYINCDLDEAGKKSTYGYDTETGRIEGFEERGLIPLMLPDVVYEKHEVKDVADFVKKFGIKRFEDFLKYKGLWNP